MDGYLWETFNLGEILLGERNLGQPKAKLDFLG